ncbi:ferredoxin family protein [Oligoflexia bacterium]|nr:ferredoxin family protein [Oligoflexia bacterium]
MTRVVTRACIGSKDRSCVEVCPVNCFYDIRKKEYNDKYGIPADGEDGDVNVGLLVIDPDECIDCGACESECPVDAIYEDSDVSDEDQDFIEINAKETVNLTDDEKEELRCTEKV